MAVLSVMIAVGALLTFECGGVIAGQEPGISGTWERTPDDWYGQDPDAPILPGGKVDMKEPFASEYQALKKRQAAANTAGTPLVTASTRCLPEGMPTIMAGLFPIQIVRDADHVVVLGEYLSQVRRILMDQDMPSKDKLEPSFQGQSRGHWEGDTLVVETRGVRTDARLYDLPHGKDMKITERIRLTAPDRLENKIVIEDPEVLNSPYRFTFEYKRSSYAIQEYVCENNQSVIDSDGKVTIRRD
ncbi:MULTISPECIES: hypothetical protein [Burkholderia cepacia complex]|nr:MULTISPECIES: hypothetical protein [Burkholderia cepacia complex]MDA3672167.1 hypothetical protein [Burkholderia cenocepacia]MDA3681478.1 hypothetical protein [Burkholderia cenocepacia]MDA3689091.1 hypothetical protein [Burkholderia cenocepacia]MDA3696476.1 hypothetical protein [Burkholderia cenocepacia]MDA3703873.1 hypothetical protein [Burkholderia cenocepacia]